MIGPAKMKSFLMKGFSEPYNITAIMERTLKIERSIKPKKKFFIHCTSFEIRTFLHKVTLTYLCNEQMSS